MYCYVEMKTCSCTHAIKSSMPMIQRKVQSPAVNQGQINFLSSTGASKMFWI